MKRKQLNWQWLAAGLLAVTLAVPARASEDADIELLKQQIQTLSEKVRVLEQQRAGEQDAAAAATKTAPLVSLGANGFIFQSAGSNFVAQLHGVVQFDSRSYFHDGGVSGNDGFLLRRARPIFSGTLYHDFDFMLVPDFGGSAVQIQDAYINYRYQPSLQLQAGKFKSPVGLEQLESDPNTLFNERSLATDLVPNRDLGAELHGELLDGRASYAAGIFNGAPDYAGTTTNQSFQDYKSAAGRIFFQPWKNSGVEALAGLGFGVGGSFQANHPNTNSATGLTPGYNSDGQQKFFAYNSGVAGNGSLWRISPQAYYFYGPLGLLAEYTISDQWVGLNNVNGDFRNTAWEVTGSWVLTGEDATYNGVTPLRSFDPHANRWGAWQVVARFADLSVDDNLFTAHGGNYFASNLKSADGAQAWSVGLNWYLNKNLRANLSYSHTTFSGYEGGSSASGNPAIAQPENVVFSRLQLSF